jgi:hypothetical protein
LTSPHKSSVPPPGVAHSRRSAVLLLVALVASTTPLPYTAVAVIPVLWAGVESVRSIAAWSSARSTTASTARPSTRGIVSGFVGLGLACVLTVVVLLPYAFYGTAKNLQDCTLGANTAIAAAACNSDFNSRLDSIFGGFLSSGLHAGG